MSHLKYSLIETPTERPKSLCLKRFNICISKTATAVRVQYRFNEHADRMQYYLSWPYKDIIVLSLKKTFTNSM